MPTSLRDVLERSGTLAVLGEENVVVETPVLMESLTIAYELAERARTGGSAHGD